VEGKRPAGCRAMASLAAPSFAPGELQELQKAPLNLHALTPHQQECVDYMCARLNELSAEQLPQQKIREPTRLLRFLRSNQWDCLAAWTAYEGYLRFRKDKGLDDLVANVLDVNRDFFAGGTELSQLHFHEASEKSDAVYPRCYTAPAVDGGRSVLTDVHGNMLIIETPGSVDFAAIVELGVDSWIEALLWHTEMRLLLLDEFSIRTGSLARTCTLIDMGKLKTSLLMPGGGSRREQEGFKAWQGATKFLSANYPDTTYRNYMLNVPAAWLIEKLIVSMAPARSKDKYKVSGSGEDVVKTVSADVPVELVPAYLGGGLDWRPGTLPPLPVTVKAAAVEPAYDGLEEGLLSERSLARRDRMKKRGVSRQFQRFGHWLYNDHPEYEESSFATWDEQQEAKATAASAKRSWCCWCRCFGSQPAAPRHQDYASMV